DFLQEFGAADGGTGAEAGHAVDFGEGAEDDQIVILDEVGADGSAGEVDIGFIEQDDGAGGFVGQEPFDIFARGEGAGGVVGVDDVDDAWGRGGGGHGFDVVGEGF